MVPSWSIPFKDREFRIVCAICLAIPECLAKLIDWAHPCGDQTFHSRLRRRLQIKRPHIHGPCQAGRHQFSLGMRKRTARDKWSFDFGNAPVPKELAHAAKYIG